jgi:hypothetical protein
MYKIRRQKPCLMFLMSNQPLALILIDAEITYNKGTLVVIKATSKSLPAFETA